MDLINKNIMSKKEIKHKVNNNKHNLRDIILGGQDGLVNVLGVVLAVAIATKDLKIILIAGLAATFAESLSMAAVAYTSFKAAKQYYLSKVEEEKENIKRDPKEEIQEIKEIYSKKGFSGNLLNQITKKITSNKKLWVSTMISEELGLSPEEYSSPTKSAFVVGFSALIGSLIPLLPFLLNLHYRITFALIFSIITLFVTGAIKAKVTIGNWIKSGLEMTFIGILAALIGYLIGLGLSNI
tara:strand:+ start:32884 stop:33603 length:720 start_codon:yes stop_codon:yes gene_type:complete